MHANGQVRLRAVRFGATAFARRVAAGEGWWSRWVTLPHQLACRASALLVCHDPGKIYDLRFWIYDYLAGRLGAAPSRLNFGGLVARLVRGRGKIVNRK